MELLKNSENKVVGMKQTIRGLESNSVEVVYVALNADKKIVDKVLEIAVLKKVKIVKVPTMEELGKCCNIKVPTATCAILKI